jgi:hypothetical protein
MSNLHNPIAQLITQIQDKWNTEVVPYKHIKLVRWIIKPDQARLFEGFLRLESTENGSIPDMTIVLLTPFKNKEEHSTDLITDWIKTYRDDTELIENYSKSNKGFNWDADSFEKKIKTTKNDTLLIEMLAAFQKALPDENRAFTLCLFPHTVSNSDEYLKWIDTLIELKLPNNVRFMVFDYASERYLDKLFLANKNGKKSLSLPLDVDAAIEKLANSGDNNQPDIQFRQCMINMSKSIDKNNIKDLHKWGKRGLEVTQKTGIKSIYSTAYIVYAGNLFSFKKYKIIEDLLLKGLAIAKQGIQIGDDACKPLIIQYYGYQAIAKQMQKENKDAADLFCKQADTAIEFGFEQTPLNAWWLAYNAIKKQDTDYYRSLVEKAYNYGEKLEKETLKSTTMAFIADDFITNIEGNSKCTRCEEVDVFMTEVEGKGWRERTLAQRKEMEKKKSKFSLLNWF